MYQQHQQTTPLTHGHALLQEEVLLARHTVVLQVTNTVLPPTHVYLTLPAVEVAHSLKPVSKVEDTVHAKTKHQHVLSQLSLQQSPHPSSLIHLKPVPSNGMLPPTFSLVQAHVQMVSTAT